MMNCKKCGNFSSSLDITIQYNLQYDFCQKCCDMDEIINANKMFNISPSPNFFNGLRDQIKALPNYHVLSFRDKTSFCIDYIKYRCFQAPIRVVSFFCLLFAIFLTPMHYLNYVKENSMEHIKNNPQALLYWQMPAEAHLETP